MTTVSTSSHELPASESTLMIKQKAAAMTSEQSQADNTFSQWVLNTGFCFALLLAAACLVMSGIYLYKFQGATSNYLSTLLQIVMNDSSGSNKDTVLFAINANNIVIRFALLSCGISVAMSFGFLGFALFLLGIKGEMSAQAQHESTNVKITRMAPGVFVILCAAVLIGLCVTYRISFDYSQKDREPLQGKISPPGPDVGPPTDPNP